MGFSLRVFGLGAVLYGFMSWSILASSLEVIINLKKASNESDYSGDLVLQNTGEFSVGAQFLAPDSDPG